MSSTSHPPIIYLGFNDPREHTRGTENVIRAQAAATGVRNYYVYRSSKFDVFRWGRIIAIGCPINLLLAGLFLWRLVKRIRRRKNVIPLVHGHSYLLSAVAFGAPLVFTVHDALAYQKFHVGAKHLWIFDFLERFVYWRAVKIHSISNYTWSQACSSSEATAKLTIIPNSIATEVTQSDMVNASAISRGSPEYLIVRSIEERANLDLVLQLAKHCLEHEPDAQILVAGKGPLLLRYRKAVIAQGLTNLHFLGYVSDTTLNALYQRASCVIMTAIYGEGFGLPLIEAYARGIPAVGSHVCAVPEVIADPALLFKNELAELLAAISVATEIPREKFVNHFNRNFSRDAILEQYRNFYESAAKSFWRLD
jgi:glycosyltransferase involved in cell wall biosynthesis